MYGKPAKHSWETGEGFFVVSLSLPHLPSSSSHSYSFQGSHAGRGEKARGVISLPLPLTEKERKVFPCKKSSIHLELSLRRTLILFFGGVYKNTRSELFNLLIKEKSALLFSFVPPDYLVSPHTLLRPLDKFPPFVELRVWNLRDVF